MSRKKKPNREPLQASLCRGRLQETVDGEWYTNGHWLVRKWLCKLIKSSPAVDSEIKPDQTSLHFPAPEDYVKATIVYDITLRGLHPLIVDGSIVTWIDSQYAEAWDRAEIFVAGPDDPLFVGAPDIDVALVVIMPVRLQLAKEHKRLLGNWCKRR